MKTTLLLSFGISTLFVQTMCWAAVDPTKYQIFDAGYQKSMPLREKLSIRQREFFHKKTGLYIGASDSVSNVKPAPPGNSSSQNDQYSLDAYAGVKHQVGIFGYHLGFKSYNQLLATETLNREIEVQEMYVGGNIKALHVSYATNNEGAYTQLNFRHDISDVTLGFHLGKTQLLLGEDFTDWSLFATKQINDVKLNAIVVQSDDPRNSDIQINFGVEKKLSLF